MACVSSSRGPTVLVNQAAKPIPVLDLAGARATTGWARQEAAEGAQDEAICRPPAGTTDLPMDAELMVGGCR